MKMPGFGKQDRENAATRIIEAKLTIYSHMKKLEIKLDGLAQMLTKDEMKKITGGVENAGFYCFVDMSDDTYIVIAHAPDADSAQAFCDAYCWGDDDCYECDCSPTAIPN